MDWQRTYPTQDGLYWFWGGKTGDPSQAPQIVEVWEDVWYTMGDGSMYYANEFPGYCAGPLVPPPLTGEGAAAELWDGTGAWVDTGVSDLS